MPPGHYMSNGEYMPYGHVMPIMVYLTPNSDSASSLETTNSFAPSSPIPSSFKFRKIQMDSPMPESPPSMNDVHYMTPDHFMSNGEYMPYGHIMPNMIYMTPTFSETTNGSPPQSPELPSSINGRRSHHTYGGQSVEVDSIFLNQLLSAAHSGQRYGQK